MPYGGPPIPLQLVVAEAALVDPLIQIPATAAELFDRVLD
jgi:hypothetical protein